MLVVPANSDIKSLADLTAKVKANPSSVTWAVGSAGGIDHVIAGQITKAVSGDASKTNAINYAGGGEQIASILGGHVTVGVGGVPEFASQIKSGKLRALAVYLRRAPRRPRCPDPERAGRRCCLRHLARADGQKQATDAEKKELGARLRRWSRPRPGRPTSKGTAGSTAYQARRRVRRFPEGAAGHDEDRAGRPRPPEVTKHPIA